MNAAPPSRMNRPLKTRKYLTFPIQSMSGRRNLSHLGNVSGKLLRFFTCSPSIRMLNTVRVTNSDVNRLLIRPISSVVPNPFTSSAAEPHQD